MLSGERISNEALEELTSVGFTSIQISNSTRDRVRASFDAGRAFFNLTLQEKLLNRLARDTGYRPTGVEYSESPEHPDEMESFSVSRRLVGSEATLHSQSARTLHGLMLGLADSLELVAETLTASIASKLACDSVGKLLRGGFRDWSVLQMNYSRPNEIVGECINDCHEDGCLMTMTSVTAPGLELKALDGSFVPVFPTAEQLLVMSGEILGLLSGGKIRPTYHRVRPTATCRERLSLLFFADLHPALCSPWIRNETNINIDIADRVLQNSARYGLTKWTLE